MRRILVVAICVILCLTGCSIPTTPTSESTSLPVDIPVTSSTPKTGIATTPVPVVAEPESAPDLNGEWVGYLGGDQVDFALEWTWAAKLNIRTQDAWLSLDRIGHEADTLGTPFIKPLVENAGAQLEILSRDDKEIILSIAEYAYYTDDEPPLPTGTQIVLNYMPVNDEQGADTLTVAKYIVQSYTRFPDEVFEGEVQAASGSKLCAAAFARLSLPNTESRSYPRWENELNNLSSGVRGVYTFGETGADNDNSSYIFVYADEQGYEHIRMTFCWIIGAARQGTSTAFITTEPEFFGQLSMASVPYWNTLYELDAATGEFIDVSAKYTDYYRDVYIPRYKWFLSEGKPGASADRESRESYEAKEEMLRRALAITEGKSPRKLPPVPTLRPNAPSITADVFGDGEPVLIEPCFLTVFPKNAPNYDAVKLRINGEWTHSFLFDDIVDAALYTIDIDEGKPGVDLAFQLYDSVGAPYVDILGLMREGYAHYSSVKLWGMLPANDGELAVTIPGDKTATGVKQSVRNLGELLIYNYTFDEFGFLESQGSIPSESITPESILTPDDAIKKLGLMDHFTFCAMTHGDFLGDETQDTAVLFTVWGMSIYDVSHFGIAVIDGGRGGVVQREIVTHYIHGPDLRTVLGPDNKEALLASFDSGNSGGERQFKVFDVANDQFIDMFHHGSRELEPVGTLLDDYEARVNIERTSQTFTFSVEGHRENYIDAGDGIGLYTSEGKLRTPDYDIMFDDLSNMKCETINGRQVFIGVQYGSAWGHADVICAVYSQYGYDADGEIALEKVWLESLAEAE